MVVEQQNQPPIVINPDNEENQHMGAWGITFIVLGSVLLIGTIVIISIYYYRKQDTLRNRTGFRSWLSKGAKSEPDKNYMTELYSERESIDRKHVIDGGSFNNVGTNI